MLLDIYILTKAGEKDKRKGIFYMPLINCNECGKEISDKAASCPNCGSPIGKKKYCKFCAEQIDYDCIICPKCGKQVEEMHQPKESIIINNTSTAYANANNSPMNGKAKNKWVSLLLCLFLGCFGVHKFYEGKIMMGLIYLFTVGLFFVGVVIDFIVILTKPNPYYV